MEKVNTDELISKLISGTYEEFCDSIVVFLEIVSISIRSCDIYEYTYDCEI